MLLLWFFLVNCKIQVQIPIMPETDFLFYKKYGFILQFKNHSMISIAVYKKKIMVIDRVWSWFSPLTKKNTLFIWPQVLTSPHFQNQVITKYMKNYISKRILHLIKKRYNLVAQLCSLIIMWKCLWKIIFMNRDANDTLILLKFNILRPNINN